MFTSAMEVIEYLTQYHSGGMEYSASSVEDWAEQVMQDECIDLWEAFAEEYNLSDFSDFDELEGRWEDFKDDFMTESFWDRYEVESAVEREVETVFDEITSNMDADDKFVAIKRLT